MPGGNISLLTNVPPSGEYQISGEYAVTNVRMWGQASVRMPLTVPGGGGVGDGRSWIRLTFGGFDA